MGAAFGQSFVRGLSVSAAIIATQFPQEIADLAILIDLGISLRRTLLLNLVPAVLSYGGFGVGVKLNIINRNLGGGIFAVAAGMYLFIVLSALIPEMSEKVLKMLKESRKEGVIIIILQIVAIILGMTSIFFISLKSGDITLE